MGSTEYPEQGSRFQKSFQPYCIRVRKGNLPRISGIDGCRVMHAGPEHPEKDHGEFISVVIETNEGTLEADLGDWVCLDSQGRPYPVEHEEFTSIYEPVTSK